MALLKSIMYHAAQERFPRAGTGRYESSDNSPSNIQLFIGHTLHAGELGIVVNHVNIYLIVFQKNRNACKAKTHDLPRPAPSRLPPPHFRPRHQVIFRVCHLAPRSRSEIGARRVTVR